MNAITAVLLVLAIHLGGTEVDSAPGSQVQWFQDARLTGEWVMSDVDRGIYRFIGADGTAHTGGGLVVQRLAEPDLTFAVTMTDSSGTPMVLSLLSLPVRTFTTSASSVSVPREDILSAFSRVGSTETDSEPPVATAVLPESGDAELTVQRADGLITAGDPASGQVLLLRY